MPLVTRRTQRRGPATVAAVFVLLFVAAAPVYAGGSRQQPTASAARIESDITALASLEFAGRLTGSDGNIEAARYLATALEQLGYAGADGGSVLEWYTQPVILAEEPPTLVVSDGSGTGKRFGPGQVDVLIRAGCRISGTVSGNVVEFPDTEPSPEWVSEHRDAILFIDAKRFGELTSNQELMAALFHPDDSPQAIVLTLPAMLTTLPRGVFLTHESYANKGPMLAQATADTAATIRAAGPAAQLTLSSHYRVVEREVPNVVARLHSRRPNAPDDSQRAQATGDARPPIVLSAHFDGTGDMSSRVRYPSAVDNASGTAVVLELARLLAASQGAPSTDVWIVFFNGEEQGLYGSREFVQRHRTQMRDAIVLNLDMVGHGTDAPYTVSFTEDSGAVARELANALNDAGLATTPARGGGSDHASFEGTARAVSVVQAPYRFMHQQGDVADVAAPESLAAIVSVLLKFVSGR